MAVPARKGFAVALACFADFTIPAWFGIGGLWFLSVDSALGWPLCLSMACAVTGKGFAVALACFAQLFNLV